MTNATTVATMARNYLRDFPKFFQLTFDAVGRTYELGHINVDPDTLYVATYIGTDLTELEPGTDYHLDSRNGILRLATTPQATTQVMIEGYYYEWVLPADLDFYAQHAINSHTYNLSTSSGPVSGSTTSMSSLHPVVVEVIGIAAVIEALWALLTEYARDIDVMTSESIHIPASQRFRMVEQLLQYWQKQYESKAKALNIGLNRIEVFTLRRVSRTTNRLVPLFKSKELGDYGPIERLFPPIDDGVIDLGEPDEPLRTDVFIDGAPPQGYSNGTFF